MKLHHIVLILFFMLGSSVAAAEDFDGSKPLVCAINTAIDCVPGQTCVEGQPDVIGAPQFLKIDFEKREIIGTKRTSPILRIEKSEEYTLLYGTELNMGWVVALDHLTGKVSTTLVNVRGAFVLFGACTTL